MKTAEDTARSIELNCGILDEPGEYFKNIMHFLKEFEESVRKEQDKITRHACAENVMSISFDNEDMTGDQHLIDANKSFAAIMNTKAV